MAAACIVWGESLGFPTNNLKGDVPNLALAFLFDKQPVASGVSIIQLSSSLWKKKYVYICYRIVGFHMPSPNSLQVSYPLEG